MFLAEAVVSHEAVTVRVKYCNEMEIIFSTSPRATGRRAPTKDIVSLVITANFLSQNVRRRQFSVYWKCLEESCPPGRQWSNTRLATRAREQVGERGNTAHLFHHPVNIDCFQLYLLFLLLRSLRSGEQGHCQSPWILFSVPYKL